MLFLDLSKARKGEMIGGKYLWRWWHGNRWNYKYASRPHENHGIAETGKQEHSIEVHPESLVLGHTPEEAFHHARQKALKGKERHEAVYLGPDGQPQHRVVVQPGQERPIMILPAESKGQAREAVRQRTFSALERWHRLATSVTTINDAFGDPWFDVRAGGPRGRLSVRYYGSSPFNPYQGAAKREWVAAPVGSGKDLQEWIKNQHKRQQETRRGTSQPAKKFPVDKERPATMALEQGKIKWSSKQVRVGWESQQAKGWRKRWIREAGLGNEEQQSRFYRRIMGEHFGLVIMLATRQLRLYHVSSPESTIRLVGATGAADDPNSLQFDPTAPSFKGIQRAVNSYDPAKGFRFSTYLSDCLWWEYFRETSRIVDEIKQRRRMITGDALGEAVDRVDLQHDATPGYDQIIGAGAHYRQADEGLIHDQENLQEWKVRQEDRLARLIAETKDSDLRRLAHQAFREMQATKNLEQANAFVVHYQSEGGHQFAEPVTLEPPKHRRRGRLTKQERQAWTVMVESHLTLTQAEKAALQAAAPDGDLENMRPIHEIAENLHRDHPEEFPTKPSETRIANLFYHAFQALSGRPEFEAMREKLSPIQKAILILRSAQDQVISDALDVLSKGKKGEQLAGHKYIKREAHPGGFRYYYQEPKTNNYVQGTNAPVGHGHHDPALGEPARHPSEPSYEESPEYFDPKGRKLNRAAVPEAEWNREYDPKVGSGQNWASRWPKADADPSNPYEYAYYDEDTKNRADLKYNASNKHFDSQLPKVRQWYKSLLKSKELPDQTLGLMVAMLDQAMMRAGKKQHEKARGTVSLCTLKVENVKLRGTTAIFSYTGKKEQQQENVVRLDDRCASILKTLITAPGKRPRDYLFAVPVKVGGRMVYRDVGYNMLHRSLKVMGVTAKQFRTYHGTRLFVSAFRSLSQEIKGRVTPDVLKKITMDAATQVAGALGHFRGKGKEQKPDPTTTLRAYIDPVVIKSLYVELLSPEKNLDKAFKLQGRMEFQGLPISVENKAGSVRHWKDHHSGTEGDTKMVHPYGYIRRTEGADGDSVDVFVGPKQDAKNAYVVHQMKAPHFIHYDEDKAMLGFESPEEAKAAYLKHYNEPRYFGKMSTVPMEQFKEKVLDPANHRQMIKAMLEELWGEALLEKAARTPIALLRDLPTTGLGLPGEQAQKTKMASSQMEQGKLKPDHITKQSQPLGIKVPKEQHPLSVMGFHRVMGGLKLKDLNNSVATHHPDYESGINHVDVDHSRFDPSTDTGQVRTHGVVRHKATGEKVGKFCRTFIRQGPHLSVHHDSFTMDDAHQGNGVAKDLLKNSVKLYRKMGAERITTDPAAVGLYTWARMGFHYGPKGTKEVQKRLPKYLMEKHNIAPEVAQRITENVADRPWRVAALHVRGQHVGKDFMLDHGEDIWKHHGGTLELHDRNPGFRHFKKYVGIKD